jgi:hypothetical protein
MSIETGRLKFSESESLYPGLKQAEFREGAVGKTAPVLSSLKEFASYKVGKLSYMGRDFFAVVQFKNGFIDWVSLSRLASPDESWASYDQAREEAWVEETRIWLGLVTHYSLPAEFPWGTLDCRFDPRSGAGAVILSYRNG